MHFSIHKQKGRPFCHSMNAPHEICLQSTLLLLKKRSLKILNLSDLDQGHWMTLTFGTRIASCTHLVDFIYQLDITDCNSFWKIHCFNIFPYISIRKQIWPCLKNRSRSTRSDHFNKPGTCSTRVPNLVVLFVLEFYSPVNNEVMSSQSVNMCTVPGQA